MSQAIFRMSALMVLVVGLAHAADSPGVPAPSAAAPAAHWVERKLDFTYMGFTTHYSCDGLEDDVRQVLLALGARKADLKVQAVGCTRGFEHPEPFPGVSARFSVLVPVTPDDIGKVGNTTAQPTQWKTVDLTRMSPFSFDQGQCELLEQLKAKALPLFTTRNLKFRSTCVPHQISPGDLQFIVDVLRAAPAAPVTGAAPPPAA